MKFYYRSLALAAALACAVFTSPAVAQSAVNDQSPIPLNTTGLSELKTQSITVPGGTLYVSVAKQPGSQGGIAGVTQTFVASGAASPTRSLALTGGKTDPGVPMTASPGAGVFGVSRTAGTSLVLTGETTSSNAKTDKVIFEFDLPDSYVTGAVLPVVINANYSGGGTVTAVSTTVAVAAYLETNGVETAITGITAAQQITSTATNYTFNVPGTLLSTYRHIVLEVTLLVTSASGSNIGQINRVAIQG